jgi:NAD dependent epimerase/dehydratase family enzyme
MNIALTGATGFVGCHILTELRGHGHEVVAFVRDDAQADRAAAHGAAPVVVDLYDQSTVVRHLSGASARDELGWSPTHPDLVDDLRHGSYRQQPTRVEREPA